MSNRFRLARATAFRGPMGPSKGGSIHVVSKPCVLTRLTKHQPVPKHLQGDGVDVKVLRRRTSDGVILHERCN